MNCKHCCIACGVISFDSVTTVMGCCTPFAFSVCKMFLTVIRWFFARVLAIKILTIHIRIFWKAGWFSSLVAPLVFLWLSTVGSTWKLDRRLSCSQTLQFILIIYARGFVVSVARQNIQTSYYRNIINSVPLLLITWNMSTLKDRAKAKGRGLHLTLYLAIVPSSMRICTMMIAYVNYIFLYRQR